MKIYTKQGDQGRTSLASGNKVSKTNLRIAAYGAVDELGAQLGLLRDLLTQAALATPSLDALPAKLLVVQEELFELSSELSYPAAFSTTPLLAALDAATLSRLEADIDTWQAELPPLRNFTVAGGHPLNSQAHIARCVARRAERETVRVHEAEALRPILLQYLNRLSDWLFVLGRLVSARCGAPETLWRKKR